MQPRHNRFRGIEPPTKRVHLRDEIYVPINTPYSRKNVGVLARLDATKIDLKVLDLHPSDGDFPVAWVKNYGNGRVFYSSLGHPPTAVGTIRRFSKCTLRPSNGHSA
jgi:uncharacterized protein